MKAPNETLDALRLRFLSEIDKAAPITSETTYGEWQDAIDAYFATLKPWLRPQLDFQCDHEAFNHLPGKKLLFHAYGYGFFRAWLRRQGLNPDDYHPEEACTRGKGLDAGTASNHRAKNRLFAYRERSGLTLQQVASLIGSASVDELRQYEEGTKVPDLEHALALEIVYKTPVRMLFPDMASQARKEIEAAGSTAIIEQNDVAA